MAENEAFWQNPNKHETLRPSKTLVFTPETRHTTESHKEWVRSPREARPTCVLKPSARLHPFFRGDHLHSVLSGLYCQLVQRQIPVVVPQSKRVFLCRLCRNCCPQANRHTPKHEIGSTRHCQEFEIGTRRECLWWSKTKATSRRGLREPEPRVLPVK